MKPTGTSPLDGVRVLELASYVAGPHCGMMLADLGAEVIKIEPPEGDLARRAPPGQVHGETPYFLQMNRNKKSVVLDLKEAVHKKVFADLVARSDVLVTAFTARTKANLGLDFESLSAINSRLILCSITGYGDTGPYRERPGYDFLAQCISGIAHIHGDDADGVPRVSRLSITDLTTGVYSAFAVLAALRQREMTGRGQFIDMGILDVAISYLSYTATNHLAFGTVPARPSNSSHPYWVPSQIFRTADSYIYIAVLPAHHWRLLCDALGLEEWRDEYSPPSARAEHRVRITEKLNEVFARRTASEWIALLASKGVPCAPVNDLPTALADPQVAAREMIVPIEHPAAGLVSVVGNPVKLSDHPTAYGPAPLLGQHTEQIMRDVLGYRADAVAAMCPTTKGNNG